MLDPHLGGRYDLPGEGPQRFGYPIAHCRRPALDHLGAPRGFGTTSRQVAAQQLVDVQRVDGVGECDSPRLQQ